MNKRRKAEYERMMALKREREERKRAGIEKARATRESRTGEKK